MNNIIKISNKILNKNIFEYIFISKDFKIQSMSLGLSKYLNHFVAMNAEINF